MTGSCTNGAGLTTDADRLTIKLDKSGPTATLAVTAGTAGANGWYTTDVTVATTGTDAISGPVTCTADQHQTTETAGHAVQRLLHQRRRPHHRRRALTVKLDKTAPTGSARRHRRHRSAPTAGTPPTSPSPPAGTDAISGPVTCTADQYQSRPRPPAPTFNGSCTNDAGLTTNAAPLTVKLDKTGPSADLAVAAGTRRERLVHLRLSRSPPPAATTISGPVTCTGRPALRPTETAGQDVQRHLHQRAPASRPRRHR